jgi:hypothetical protein
VHTRDGEPDRIDCGDGDDRAILDFADVIVDATPGLPNGACERVERAAARSASTEEGAS